MYLVVDMKVEDDYKNYYYFVLNYIQKVGGYPLDDLEIEDAVNNTLKIFSLKFNREKINSAHLYIKKIAYNVVRNIYRTKRNYYNRNCELQDYHYDKVITKDILNVLILKERHEIIFLAINKLDYLEKKFILLLYYRNFSYLKISQLLNINYTKLKKIETMALSKLKYDLLTNYYLLI